MKPKTYVLLTVCFVLILVSPLQIEANPWNAKVILQAFWWDCTNQRYQTSPDGTGGWYTYLAKLAPRLRAMGFDGIWVPSPCKGANAKGMGYDLFDHYDLGNKYQKGSVATRFGNQDAFLRMIAVAHANGLDVYPDVVLNHMSGGDIDPNARGGNRYKTFQYASFEGLGLGRWPKTWLDFHPNPHHSEGNDDWRIELFGPDICYHGPCCDNDCEHAGSYMRDQARQWFVWFRKQTDADGFRFDAVKHFPPEVVEDLLYNAMDMGKPESTQRHYMAVGEFVVGLNEQDRIDGWANQTKNRCGTFDFALREALVNLVHGQGFFDMGSLPNFQQHNRYKTVPFINNHDTWRGAFSDSGGNGQSDHSGYQKNKDELIATIDPDNDWSKIAYAAIMAVDGSPMVYYEDLFKNYDLQTRNSADPRTHPTRAYIENLVWCHQKLNLKDGAYKIRFQGSPDILVFERSAKAVIGLNDNGNEHRSATIDTDFGPNVTLHDYSGSTTSNLKTDQNGRLVVTVPPKSYCIWGPEGVTGGFWGPPRRTIQEFQLDDDLGDNQVESLRYGGRLGHVEYRTGGAVWIAENTVVKVWVYADAKIPVDLKVSKPNQAGAKATDQGEYIVNGFSAPNTPLYMQFLSDREGYHQLSAKQSEDIGNKTKAYIKVEYEGPAYSQKF